MASVFTKIVQGEIPCYKIAETKDYFAFLDISPLAMGHTLVIPKKEVDYLFKMEDELYAGLLLFAKRIALAIQSVVPCLRVGVTVIGIEVPHAHIHLIPINQVSDINFSMPKKTFSPEAMSAMANSISSAYKQQSFED